MKEEAVTQQPQDRAILTAEDVAELLSMNPQTVRRYWMKRGRYLVIPLPEGEETE